MDLDVRAVAHIGRAGCLHLLVPAPLAARPVPRPQPQGSVFQPSPSRGVCGRLLWRLTAWGCAAWIGTPPAFLVPSPGSTRDSAHVTVTSPKPASPIPGAVRDGHLQIPPPSPRATPGSACFPWPAHPPRRGPAPAPSHQPRPPALTAALGCCVPCPIPTTGKRPVSTPLGPPLRCEGCWADLNAWFDLSRASGSPHNSSAWSV